METKKEERIQLQAINVKHATVTIIGDGDLVLNKMNDVTARELIDQRKDKAKNLDALTNNAPCITAFGLLKCFCDAVVRNGVDTYSTKFKAGVNIIAKGGLIPIKFAEHYIDEKLMSPKKGKPVLVHLNRFTGWSAEIELAYVDNIYSIEQIVNIIQLAGFGCGIGSGRTSGYGRFHVE